MDADRIKWLRNDMRYKAPEVPVRAMTYGDLGGVIEAEVAERTSALRETCDAAEWARDHLAEVVRRQHELLKRAAVCLDGYEDLEADIADHLAAAEATP